MNLKLYAFSGFSRLLILIYALVLIGSGNAYSQHLSVTPGTVEPQECPDPAPQTSGIHRFRRLGETIEIPISVADCQALALELNWSNGRNNGSNFNVTFFDNSNRPIYTRQLSAFMAGSFEFPLSTFYSQPAWGSGSLISVPSTVTIEAVSPFAYPASLSYTVTRIARHPRPKPAAVNSKERKGEADSVSSTLGKVSEKQ